MEEYIQQLLQDQGVPHDLDPEVRGQLVSDLMSRALDFLNRRLIDSMSDEAVEHFTSLLDNPATDASQVQDFIATNVMDKEKVTADALAEFRVLYLGDKA